MVVNHDDNQTYSKCSVQQDGYLKMTLEERKKFGLIYAGALFGFLISKGQALVPGFALDDYIAIHQDRNPLMYMWQGRFTQALIQVALTWIGIPSNSIAWPVILLFFVFASLAIALGISHVARNHGRTLGLASLAAVMACHPYLTEYFTFRESLITQGMAFALIALSFLIARADRPNSTGKIAGRFIALVCTMVLLAGAQQTAFIVLGFFIAARLLLDTIDPTRAIQSEESKESKLMIRAFLAASLAYVAVFVVTTKMGGVPMDSRSSLIGISAIGERFPLVLGLAGKLLLKNEPVLSLAVKGYLFLLYIVLVIIAGMSRPKIAIAIFVTSIVFFCGSIFLVSVSGTWWPVPRAVYGLGFALGISLLMVYLSLKKDLSLYFSIAVWIGAIGLSFNSSAILFDQIRLNRWDAWVAGSIARDLSEIGVNSDQKVILVGANWVHPIGLKTIDGDLNTSALSVPWAVNHLFMETTGRNWHIESIGDSIECNDVEIWPSKQAFKKTADLIYVCMGKR
jgi:hypothetical protein